jgi:hypothetical protein
MCTAYYHKLKKINYYTVIISCKRLVRDQRHSFIHPSAADGGVRSAGRAGAGAGAGGEAPLEVERPEPGAPPAAGSRGVGQHGVSPLRGEHDGGAVQGGEPPHQLREQRGHPPRRGQQERQPQAQQPLAAAGRRLPPPRRLAAGPPPPQPQRPHHPDAPCCKRRRRTAAVVTELAAQPLVPVRRVRKPVPRHEHAETHVSSHTLAKGWQRPSE